MILFAIFGFYHRKEAIVHRFVQRELEERFPGLVVRMESVQLTESKGVTIRNLKLSDPSFHGKEHPILEIDETFIQAPVSFTSLFKQQTRPERVTMTKPLLHLEYHTPSRLAELLRIESLGRDLSGETLLCPMEIHGGGISFVVQTQGKRINISETFQGIDATLLPPNDQSSHRETDPPPTKMGEKTTTESLSLSLTSPPSREVPPQVEEDGLWRLEGSCENAFVKSIHFNGRATPDFADWQLDCQVDSMEIDPRVFTRYLGKISLSEVFESFQGRTSLGFTIRKDPRKKRGFRYQLKGEIFRGSLVIPFFDHPVSDLFVRYQLTDDHLTLERVTARSGPVLILARYDQTGFGPDRTFSLKTLLDEFPLTEKSLERLADFLPAKWNALQEGTSFSATTKINLELEGAGGRITPKDLHLHCRDLKVVSEKAPLSIDALEGDLTLDAAGRLLFAFASGNDRKSLRIQGDFQNALTDPAGVVQLTADGLPIDEALISSLPNACREEIRALHPTGTIRADATLRQTAGTKGTGSNPPELALRLDVQNGAIRYDRFPLPISGIVGEIRFEKGEWTFSNLRGETGSTELTATGQLVPVPESQDHQLTLDVQLSRFPLGDDFQNALIDPEKRRFLERLHLTGRADADVQISYHSGTNRFNLEFEARPIPDQTSIQPDHFPYPISGLEGEITYRNGEVKIPNLRGGNGPMTFSASVDCQFRPDGESTLTIDPFTIDQLSIDRQLQNALPPKLLSLLDRLNLTGFLNGSGSLRFHQDGPDKPVEGVWDTNLVFHQNSANFGKEISGVCGKAALRGIARGEDSFLLHGELDLDSLCVEDVQITHLTGPFYFNGDHLLFGKSVPPVGNLPIYQNDFLRSRLLSRFNAPSHSGQPEMDDSTRDRRSPIVSERQREPLIRSQMGQATPSTEPVLTASVTPSTVGPSGVIPLDSRPSLPQPSKWRRDVSLTASRPLSAKLFQGEANLDGVVHLTNPISYELDFNLRDGRLDEVIRDLTDQPQRLEGNLSTFVKLQGEGNNVGTLKGNGGLVLKNAALYELPLMIQVFRSLSVTEPDQTAFNSSFIDFQVFGNRLRLDRVLLEGKSLTLFGDGWLTIEGNDPKIDLTMNSRLGNVRNQIPVVSDVIGGAGDQIAQIKIDGPLSEASIRQESFPGIKKAWWSVFPDWKERKKGD